AGHPDVEKHDIRLLALRGFERRRAVCDHGDNLQLRPRLGERGLEAHRQQRLLLGNQRARAHAIGRRRATDAPPPGGPTTGIDAWAPYAAARRSRTVASATPAPLLPGAAHPPPVPRTVRTSTSCSSPA